MKIALFGGSFDPPHNGHVAVAKAVLAYDSSIDEIWLMPVPQHHWKPSVASAEDRLAMVSLLTKGSIRASDFEIRHNTTYAIDTVTQLQGSTANEYLWVAGADILPEFSRWKAYKELEKRIPFLIVPRNPYDMLTVPPHFTIMRSDMFIPTAYSSGEIRERIKQGLPVDDMLPKKIQDYIFEKKLYK